MQMYDTIRDGWLFRHAVCSNKIYGYMENLRTGARHSRKHFVCDIAPMDSYNPVNKLPSHHLNVWMNMAKKRKHVADYLALRKAWKQNW
jgi:hypothetical protein